MKTTSWLAPMRFRIMSLFLCLTMTVLWTSCSDDAVDVSAPADEAAGKSANSDSHPGDYNISVTYENGIFTYTITKNPGAKGLSHFILNLQNCAENSATFANVLEPTVNGQPAEISNSEGNTGCDVSAITTNFVKFDNLPDADVYIITFKLTYQTHGVVPSTAWLKAGTSCFPYAIDAPCCPL
jgi:hypothetical protein